MDVLLSIVLLVFGILQVILFFKIWGMTNDVCKIRELLENFSKSNTNNSSKEFVEECATIEVDDFVMEIKTQKEFKVKQIIGENKFECIERYGCVIYTFNKDEIKLISKQ
ncbi:MAG: hypothetical protein IKV77_12475 [Alistipes sp.]|jgi:protein involved in ribonucleotide reduction|nr:hypothetical protein [Alistipes sp.]